VIADCLQILATLKFEINLLPADFSVEKEEPKVKRLSLIRYSWIIFFLRLAGIPFKMKIMPTLYVIYVITVIICTYSTHVSMFVDLYILRDDLGHVLTTLRALTGLSSLIGIFFPAGKQ